MSRSRSLSDQEQEELSRRLSLSLAGSPSTQGLRELLPCPPPPPSSPSFPRSTTKSSPDPPSLPTPPACPTESPTKSRWSLPTIPQPISLWLWELVPPILELLVVWSYLQ